MPEYKQNPHPKQVYQLTMTIANAPGPFASVVGAMQFDVVTPQCLLPPDENGGHRAAVPTVDIPIVWTKVSDTQYTGNIYTDGMMDEDYHGRGVCAWQLIQARAQLKATEAAGDTRFMPSIDWDALVPQQTDVTYFAKENYPRHSEAESEQPLSFGQTDRSKMSNLKDDDLFTITFTPEAVTP